jgi:hypothetical protein
MMRIGIRTAVPLLLGAILSLPAFANTTDPKVPLTPYSAEYRVKISVLGGRLRTNLQTLGTGYRAESDIEATGLSRIVAHGAIRESSVFEPGEDGLRPTHFISVDTLTNDAETVDLGFDWDAGVASGLIDNTEFSTSISGLVLDRVSLQYGLMYDLLNGTERDTYFLQDAEKFKELTITNIGVKAVSVPFGKFNAVGIQHQQVNSSRITTLWCAEELGYLPVVIEQHRNGKLRMRAVLTEYVPANN